MDLNAVLGVTISGVREEDRTTALRLIEACGLHTGDVSEVLLRDFLVARKGGDLVGVVGLEVCGSDGLLRSLAVSDPHRRQGLGRKLVCSMEKAARGRGVKTLYLLTTSAEPFFTGEGYETISRERVPERILSTVEFSEICPKTAACMRKAIR